MCSCCTYFLTKSRAELNYHITKKRSKSAARVVHECKICDKDFHSFYLLREHKRKEHEAQRISSAEIVDVTQLMEDVDDNSLKEELEKCKHFSLDSVLEKGGHRLYNSAMDVLDPKYLLELLVVVFDSLRCAAKLKVALSFVLRKREVVGKFMHTKILHDWRDLNLWLLQKIWQNQESTE